MMMGDGWWKPLTGYCCAIRVGNALSRRSNTNTNTNKHTHTHTHTHTNTQTKTHTQGAADKHFCNLVLIWELGHGHRVELQKLLDCCMHARQHLHSQYGAAASVRTAAPSPPPAVLCFLARCALLPMCVGIPDLLARWAALHLNSATRTSRPPACVCVRVCACVCMCVCE